jgi:undecaprenyl-diphosphatase
LNDYLLSVLLGIIEGLTEFLPISSTAHLRIAQALLNVPLESGYWKTYTIVIQMGAILCLPIYFRKHIAKFLSTFPRGEHGDKTALTHPLGLTIVAFVATAIPGFLLTRVIGENLENLTIIGTSLVVGGVVMWLVDASKFADQDHVRTRRMEDMNILQAVWIGACQLLSAVFPGVSRSMATISSGQLAGMSRAAALEFSFFLSMPTMAAASGYDLLKALLGMDDNPIGVAQIDAHGWIVLAIGFAVSFIVAYAAVAWFMAWVRQRGFVPFAIYRIVIGLAVLVWALAPGS